MNGVFNMEEELIIYWEEEEKTEFRDCYFTTKTDKDILLERGVIKW